MFCNGEGPEADSDIAGLMLWAGGSGDLLPYRRTAVKEAQTISRILTFLFIRTRPSLFPAL